MDVSRWSAAPLVSIVPWIRPSHMEPVTAVGCFLHLRWTFVIWPNRLRTCASMLIGKILAFGVLDLYLGLEAVSTEQQNGNHFQNGVDVEMTNSAYSLVREEE